MFLKHVLFYTKGLKKSSHTLPCWRHTKLNNSVPIPSLCKDITASQAGLEMINPHHQDLDFHSWQNILGAQVAWRTLVRSFASAAGNRPRWLAAEFQACAHGRLAVCVSSVPLLDLSQVASELRQSIFPPCLCCCVQEWPDCADLPWGQRNSCGLAAAC